MHENHESNETFSFPASNPTGGSADGDKFHASEPSPMPPPDPFKPRPIRRLFARTWDSGLIFCLGLALCYPVIQGLRAAGYQASLSALVPQLGQEFTDTLPLWLATTLLLLLVESAMLAAWGNTPGKALLGLKILRDNKRISAGMALKRTFHAQMRGMWFNFASLSIIPEIHQFFFLRRRGDTSYDASLGVRVRSHPIRWFRHLAFIITSLAISGAILWLSLQLDFFPDFPQPPA